jgi:hypothetical protein
MEPDMAVFLEQRNDQVTDFSDLAQGWSRHGNIALSHDTSRGVFERANGSSAVYSFPLPTSNGAGFIETTVSATFELSVDLATDGAHSSANTQWVGIALRRSDGQCQWLFPNHGTGTLMSVRDTGAGPTFETAMTLPASDARRYELHIRWDADNGKIAVRARAYGGGGPNDWITGTIATTSLTAAPHYVGISMCAPYGVTDPELYVYGLRLLEPEQPARYWYALADVAAGRETIEDLLARKNRVTAASRWSRDDYAIAGSTKTWTDSTPLRDLQAVFSRQELARYRAALEAVSGLELDYAWFGVPRCAVSDQLLYSELGPTIVMASDVSGRFGTRMMSFTATSNHSFAAFDLAVGDIPDDESWLVMFVVSPTSVPAANVPLCGKQDLFKVAPDPRNGWMLWLNTANVMLDLSDTAGGIHTVSVAKTYTAGAIFAGCARVNRTTGLAEVVHDTAASGTVSVAGLSFLCDTRPLRVGDARINRAETAPHARLHALAFARGSQVEPIGLQTLTANLLTAATT